MPETLKVLITVKTYPIPSAKYDELVCTAGVMEDGSFVRLYPVNFRDLPFSRQYRKYQWIEVEANRHTGRDSRKESWRPVPDSIRTLGDPIPSNDNWKLRSKYVLAQKSASMEDLYDKQKADKTSLGIFKPKEVLGLEISNDEAEWNPKFLEELKQARLWETRNVTKEPPRKVPWKFHYRFSCDDPRCSGEHRMMIEDWEVGALYWKLIDGGKSPRQAAESVQNKFFNEICASTKDTHFFVGTVLGHGTWVVIGTFYPKRQNTTGEPLLFPAS